MSALDLLYFAMPGLVPGIKNEPGKVTLSWPTGAPLFHEVLDKLGDVWCGAAEAMPHQTFWRPGN